MSTVNFNNTTPVALANGTNVRFQSDASGNISACWSVGWTNYTPGVVGLGGMTISGSNIIYARYALLGSAVAVNIEWQGIVGGTMSGSLQFSAPTPCTGPGTLTGAGHIVGPAAYQALAVQLPAGSNINVNVIGAALTTGSTYNVRLSLTYQWA